jgi:hypothetical protein
VDRDRIVGYIAALTDDEYAQLAHEARANPTAAPLDPVTQARTEAERRQASLAEKTRQLANIRPDNGYVTPLNLAPTMADRAAAEAQRQAAAAEEPQQPQGLKPNRAQGASAHPPPATPETMADKAARLHQLSAPRPKGY